MSCNCHGHSNDCDRRTGQCLVGTPVFVLAGGGYFLGLSEAVEIVYFVMVDIFFSSPEPKAYKVSL